ncbi:MAG: hypothetical protein NXI30_10785 [bacterium]|nr:hypothetical protein [bacterium]
MGNEDADPRPDPNVGLCSACRFVKRQDTKRGAIFYRCGRADDDPSFRRYPPTPVVRCRGFEDAREA